MKARFIYLGGIILAASCMFLSCSKDDIKEKDTPAPVVDPAPESPEDNPSEDDPTIDDSQPFYIKNKYNLQVIEDGEATTDPNELKRETLTEDETEVIDAINVFSFNLFHKIYETGDAGQNLFISPYSVQQFMSVLANAAGEATRKQILSVLQYDGELSKYNACNKVIKNLLEKKQNIFSKMVVSNALWVNKDKPVYQSFLSVIRNFYDADVFAMLFDSQDAGKAINSWCSDKTNGLINEIVDDGPLPYNLFLANAVYFFSGWSNEFDESLTAKEDFTNVNGEIKKVDMMRWPAACAVAHASLENMDAVCLPLNSYFGMMVCLPHKDVGMNACMGQLDAAVWKKLLESLEYKMVDVRLPKYKMNKQLMLTDVLIKLGTGNIFLSDDAFARMTPAILSLDAVFQTSTIFVNEKGTEAAAVTGGWASSNGEEQEEHPVTEYKVDRPFFFCIYDRTIGTTLFMGAVNQL